MKCRAVYELIIDGESELFTESESGSLDFETALPRAESDSEISALLPASRPISLPLPEGEYGEEYYHRLLPAFSGSCCRCSSLLRPRQKLICHLSADASETEAANLLFIKRYADYARLFRDRDYASLGYLIERSQKLSSFRHLLSALAGPEAFYPFALYYMHLFSDSKGCELESLLAHHPQQGGSLSAVYDYADRQIESASLHDFDDELQTKMKALLLGRAQSIVLPVVGTAFHDGEKNLIPFVSSLLDEAHRREVLDGIPFEESQKHIRNYIEEIKIEAVHEPENQHDSNALAIIINYPDGTICHAGYLKREFASLAAALGLKLKARLFSLGERGMRVQVWEEQVAG